MKHEPQEIEVEVVETIDSVPARVHTAEQQTESRWRDESDWRDWSQWQGRMRRINLRWWPLWSILALLLLVPLLVLGVVVVACWVCLRIIGRLLGGR